MLRPDSSPEVPARSFFETFPPLQLIVLGLAMFFLQQALLEGLRAILDNLFVSIGISWAAAMVLLPAWMASRHPDGFGRTYRFFPLPLSQMGWLVLATAGLVFASDLLGQVNTRWISVPEWAEGTTADLTPQTTADWILASLALCVVVPLGEEILFRGLIQQAARQAYRGVIAVLFAGLLFGALHMQPWYLLPLCMLGIALGLVYEVTGSLVAPVFVHGLYNTAALANEAMTADETDVVREMTTTDTAIAGVALAVGFMAYGRLRPVARWANDDVEEGPAHPDSS